MNTSPTKTNKSAPWGRINVALATGFCIVALAFVSERLLAEPIKPVFLAIPPLLMFFYELVARRPKEHFISKSAFWVGVILVTTGIIVLIHSV